MPGQRQGKDEERLGTARRSKPASRTEDGGWRREEEEEEGGGKAEAEAEAVIEWLS